MAAVERPTVCAVLLRTSSSTSGLNFCGIIDEPVQYSRGSLKYANSGIEKIIMSCARRESAHIVCAAAEIRHASSSPRAIEAPKTLCSGPLKPRSAAVRSRSRGSGTP